MPKFVYRVTGAIAIPFGLASVVFLAGDGLFLASVAFFTALSLGGISSFCLDYKKRIENQVPAKFLGPSIKG